MLEAISWFLKMINPTPIFILWMGNQLYCNSWSISLMNIFGCGNYLPEKLIYELHLLFDCLLLMPYPFTSWLAGVWLCICVFSSDIMIPSLFCIGMDCVVNFTTFWISRLALCFLSDILTCIYYYLLNAILDVDCKVECPIGRNSIADGVLSHQMAKGSKFHAGKMY